MNPQALEIMREALEKISAIHKPTSAPAEEYDREETSRKAGLRGDHCSRSSRPRRNARRVPELIGYATHRTAPQEGRGESRKPERPSAARVPAQETAPSPPRA
jgi:hypothetical protein